MFFKKKSSEDVQFTKGSNPGLSKFSNQGSRNNLITQSKSKEYNTNKL
jgi:hypothetical protein